MFEDKRTEKMATIIAPLIVGEHPHRKPLGLLPTDGKIDAGTAAVTKAGNPRTAELLQELRVVPRAEPPRDSRRLFGLSHAAFANATCWR
jgi:hypothetical protein